MKYSPRYFYNSTPLWKKKKDPIICRVFYRPLSCIVASVLAELNVSANKVSIFAIIVAILSSMMMGWNSHKLNILGTILLNLWLLLDCVDGTMARGLGPKPWGDYLDALGFYFLIAFLYMSIGISTYFRGGVLLKKGNVIAIIVGSITSVVDVLARLVYHRYREEMHQLGIEMKNNVSELKTKRLDHILESIGPGGTLPLILLFTTILGMNDLILLFALLVVIAIFFYCLYKFLYCLH